MFRKPSFHTKGFKTPTSNPYLGKPFRSPGFGQLFSNMNITYAKAKGPRNNTYNRIQPMSTGSLPNFIINRAPVMEPPTQILNTIAKTAKEAEANTPEFEQSKHSKSKLEKEPNQSGFGISKPDKKKIIISEFNLGDLNNRKRTHAASESKSSPRKEEKKKRFNFKVD